MNWETPSFFFSLTTTNLQCVGYQLSFEEMRRQWPHCSAALNWCCNEPWNTAANCSIIAYPNTPKPAYEFIRSALRPALFSARIPHFVWKAGERFTAGIRLLNDSPAPAPGGTGHLGKHLPLAVPRSHTYGTDQKNESMRIKKE